MCIGPAFSCRDRYKYYKWEQDLKKLNDLGTIKMWESASHLFWLFPHFTLVSTQRLRPNVDLFRHQRADLGLGLEAATLGCLLQTLAAQGCGPQNFTQNSMVLAWKSLIMVFEHEHYPHQCSWTRSNQVARMKCPCYLMAPWKESLREFI